eukprot:Blabericola_migrator_1__1620@NODE_1434_length_4553_cov_5_965002_g953_i0_p2_GENE_NODE_1434_length_4553_cov_5_965002_g953_i0NODE_1434_length_4553_cov_5_965002_g953_i0_p2_ORF_typecomplete_len134_score2_53_NODE_1434_length_4553_cov_5_965002_g953_i020842485
MPTGISDSPSSILPCAGLVIKPSPARSGNADRLCRHSFGAAQNETRRLLPHAANFTGSARHAYSSPPTPSRLRVGRGPEPLRLASTSEQMLATAPESATSVSSRLPTRAVTRTLGSGTGLLSVLAVNTFTAPN